MAEDALDAARFTQLAAQGRAALAEGLCDRAADTLRTALDLWRGPVLDDLLDAPSARIAVSRLEEARLAAVEDRVDADLACGRHNDLTGELEGLTAAHPLRERMWSQRMLALYRCGRQAEALLVYGQLRDLLDAELGIAPGAALNRLHTAILRQDPALDPPPTARGSGLPESEVGSLPPLLTEMGPVFVGRGAELDQLEVMWGTPRGGGAGGGGAAVGVGGGGRRPARGGGARRGPAVPVRPRDRAVHPARRADRRPTGDAAPARRGRRRAPVRGREGGPAARAGLSLGAGRGRAQGSRAGRRLRGAGGRARGCPARRRRGGDLLPNGARPAPAGRGGPPHRAAHRHG